MPQSFNNASSIGRVFWRGQAGEFGDVSKTAVFEEANTLLDTPDLTIAREGAIQVCYVPFDHIATKARLVVVVITPGMTQAANALRPPIRPVSWDWGRKLCWGLPSAPPASAAARSEAILWPCWTGIGVARHFGIATTAEMFRPGAADVHFTSALRYPVFVDGLNYKGTPDILRSPLLRSMFVLLRREEEPSGLNRIYRLYRKEGLTVRKSAPQSPRVEGHRS